MMKWLISVVAILLIGVSSSFNVDEDVASFVRGGFDDPSGFPNYEPETEEPVVDEATGGEFEDYDEALDAKIESMTDDELEEYMDKIDTEAGTNPEESAIGDVSTSLENADDGLETGQVTAESPATDGSVADGFGEYIDDLEAEAETHAETVVDDSASSFEENADDIAESPATDESVADGFGEYIDDLEAEAENHVDTVVDDSASSFEENTDDIAESPATNESVADGFGEYIDDLEAEAENHADTVVDDSASSFEENSDDIAESPATDESVADGFGEYIDDLEAEAEAHADTEAVDGVPISLENSGDDTNEGTAPPPTTQGRAQTPNMQEEVDRTENADLSSTDSSDTELDIMPEDAVSNINEDTAEGRDASSVPIDDELMSELEELEGIPNEKELVDDYINYNEGSLDEFDTVENPETSDISFSQSEIPEGLQPSVQETTQDLDTNIESGDDTVSDSLPGSTLEVNDDKMELEPDQDSYNSEEVLSSDTPLDTDTQSVTDSHQSDEVSYDTYDRESSNYSPYNPDPNSLEINYGDTGMSSDDSIEIPDTDSEDASDTEIYSYIDSDLPDDTERYEPPSEYGSEGYTDGPSYPNGYFEEHEINEVEVDIPGHISQGNFYETEYKDYIEQSKFSLDETLSSYHTITYFLSIVLLSVIVYVAYTNRHRFCKKRRSNYAYSRLGEQYAHQPLV